MHAYERSWPTIYGKPVWNGPHSAGWHMAPQPHLRFPQNLTSWRINGSVNAIGVDGNQEYYYAAENHTKTPSGNLMDELLRSSIHDTYSNPQGPVYVTNGLAGVFKGD
eukprot:scaffold368070_cov46-Prasinocladus_malaysianus.AAC.1